MRAGDVTGPASTSNLNFAAGETTANAVTVVLAANGTINIVYDALGSVGPTTDILVDVTGYYQKTDAASVEKSNSVSRRCSRIWRALHPPSIGSVRRATGMAR